MKILIVDDEEKVGKIVRRLIIKKFPEPEHELLLAESPEQALELLSDNSVDVLITDQEMLPSRIKGTDLIAKVRESYPRTRTMILMSGTFQAEDVSTGVGFVRKPFDNNDVILTLLAEELEKIQE